MCLAAAVLASVAPGWDPFSWSVLDTTAERTAKFLGSQLRTNDQIHPHDERQ